jgi:hypothetical protein
MKYLKQVLFIVLLLGFFTPGCEDSPFGGDRVCTQIGCSDGFSVRVSDQRPDSLSISLFINEDAEPFASRHCTMPDQTCALFAEGVTPERVTVQIDWEGGAFRETFTLQYEEFQPNGPDCPPTCRNAGVEIELSDE